MQINFQQKQWIISQTKRLGFDACAFAKSEFLRDDAVRLEQWLKNDRHGNMAYMVNHFDKRTNPSLLVPGAKSVITLLYNYYPETQQEQHLPQISKYAYGKDYHEVIREKLKEFLHVLREEFGEIDGRGFIDSAPVLERSWAAKSGLGWVGKNGNLINKEKGSFFFIATLITDLEIEPDNPYSKDYCGTCTKCIDHCPTDAILPNKEIDGSKCISYFTIELKEEIIPFEKNNEWGNWIFGCDVCQDVCPWNRFSTPHHEPAFAPLPEVMNYSFSDWEEISEFTFKQIFKHSPLKRTRWKGIKRNLSFVRNTDEQTD